MKIGPGVAGVDDEVAGHGNEDEVDDDVDIAGRSRRRHHQQQQLLCLLLLETTFQNQKNWRSSNSFFLKLIYSDVSTEHGSNYLSAF